MACPIARSLERVGEWWSILIIRDALHGFARFDEFQKSLNIAPDMLTRRLSGLVDEGLLKRRRYSQSAAAQRIYSDREGPRFSRGPHCDLMKAALSRSTVLTNCRAWSTLTGWNLRRHMLAVQRVAARDRPGIFAEKNTQAILGLDDPAFVIRRQCGSPWPPPSDASAGPERPARPLRPPTLKRRRSTRALTPVAGAAVPGSVTPFAGTVAYRRCVAGRAPGFVPRARSSLGSAGRDSR